MAGGAGHKAFLASLPPAARATLTARSDAKGLRHLAGHCGIIAALMLWVGMGWPLWQLALAPLGIALAFLFTLQHECTHDTPFASLWLNRLVGTLCGVVLIQPLHWFRAFHMAHHRHTNDPARDPELASAKPATWHALIRHLSAVDYWAAKGAVLWRNALGRLDTAYVGPRQRPRVIREARGLLVLYALAIAALVQGQTWLLWLWLLPLALGFPVLRFYLLAEHGGCAHVPDMFANSRTVLTRPWVRFLAWNMPYHAEHHASPQVPFHALPQLHAAARKELQVLAPGYRHFVADYAEGLERLH